jgi:hypothetical protein
MVVDNVFGNGLLKSENFPILSRLALKINDQGTTDNGQLITDNN